MATDNVTPIRPDLTPIEDAEFDGIFYGLTEEITTLRCVLAALNGEPEVDKNENLSSAGCALNAALKRLDSLHDRLDKWHMARTVPA